MDDEASIHLLTTIVQKRQGVTSISIDAPAKVAKISYEPSVTGPRDILDTIKNTGFPGASLASKNKKDDDHVDEILQ